MDWLLCHIDIVSAYLNIHFFLFPNSESCPPKSEEAADLFDKQPPKEESVSAPENLQEVTQDNIDFDRPTQTPETEAAQSAAVADEAVEEDVKASDLETKATAEQPLQTEQVPVKKLSVVEPPAGFGDSPDHKSGLRQKGRFEGQGQESLPGKRKLNG